MMADKKIVLLMDEEDYIEFETAILREKPVPLIPNPDQPLPEVIKVDEEVLEHLSEREIANLPMTTPERLPDIPWGTNEEWVACIALKHLGKLAISGARKLRVDNDPINTDIMKRAMKKNFNK